MKLSAAMLNVLRAIDAGEPRPKAARVTLQALWSRGLIADIEERNGGAGDVRFTRWQLTQHGRLAVKTGRLMLSKRRPE